ncbi:hypothetical protein QJS04_geneDACA022519 [Acorus gramineus]|uniref:Uncharacterized protein n=1 Tax=Acorus gramineus TaxID=55184 RepID=A0AAV9A810_ACOGR|nr:hypothetical protein QJS04_geneDACA022519 [Acorus gramineus]
MRSSSSTTSRRRPPLLRFLSPSSPRSISTSLIHGNSPVHLSPHTYIYIYPFFSTLN